MRTLFWTILKYLGLFDSYKKFREKIGPSYFEKHYGKVKEYILRKDGLEIFFDTTDDYSKQWFYPRYDNGKIHEPATTQLFIDKINEKDCIIDIGAHLGYFTCLAGRLACKGEVHSFEIDSKCIPLIEKNLRLNKLNNVQVNNCAVSDLNGSEKIPIKDNPDPNLKINYNNSDFEEINSIKLDEYIKEKRLSPDIIKIDVEGAELHVLNGMEKILKKDKLNILVEIHVDLLEKYFETDYKLILNKLDKNGFSMKEVEDHRAIDSAYKKIDENSVLEGNTMIYCYKKNDK